MSKQVTGPLAGYYKALRQSREFQHQQKLIRKRAQLFAKQLANNEVPPLTEQEGYRPPEQPPTSTHFDPELIPIYGPVRRARREMLRQLFFKTKSRTYRITADPYTAEEFRRQEKLEQYYVQQYMAILGKGANWRDSLVLGSRTSRDDYSELSWILAEAVRCADAEELQQFALACKRVARLMREGISGDSKFNRSRLEATHYVMKVEQAERRTPSRKEVEQFIKKSKLPYPPSRTNKRKDSGSNSHRFFIGPLLSTLPTAVPWETQKRGSKQSAYHPSQIYDRLNR